MVLMISSDRKVFEKDSAVRRRMIEYGGITDELHIVVFSRRIGNRESGIRNEKIAKMSLFMKLIRSADGLHL